MYKIYDLRFTIDDFIHGPVGVLFCSQLIAEGSWLFHVPCSLVTYI